MWILTIIIVLINVLLYVWHCRQKEKFKDIDRIPGPPAKFFVGNALEFGNNISDQFYGINRIIKEYGSLVRIWLGPFQLHLFVTDLKYVEYFLSSNDHIKKSGSYNLLQPWLGQGLITSSGETWKKHRKILVPAFHFKILEQLFDSFHNSGKVLVEKLKKNVGKNIDIYPFITLYAMEVICDTSMRINTQLQANSDHTYIDASRGFLDIHIIRLFSVLKRHEFYFSFTSECRKQKKYTKIMHNFTEQVVQQRIQERKDDRKTKITQQSVDDVGIKKKKAFLDILLDSNEISNKEVREQVDTFMFAGHDTVSSAISFSLFELAKHLKIQKHILEELEQVVGTDKDVPITLQHLQEMEYLDRVMKEILRMYPPVPFIERDLEVDVMLGDIKVPKGTTVSFHPYAQHHNSELFPEPEKFDPDRFLPECTVDRHPFAYIPFSAGPRNCIGFKYALMNCKSTIANIIRKFELYSIEPVHEPILGNDSIIKSLNGLPIKLKLRQE